MNLIPRKAHKMQYAKNAKQEINKSIFASFVQFFAVFA